MESGAKQSGARRGTQRVPLLAPNPIATNRPRLVFRVSTELSKKIRKRAEEHRAAAEYVALPGAAMTSIAAGV